MAVLSLNLRSASVATAAGLLAALLSPVVSHAAPASASAGRTGDCQAISMAESTLCEAVVFDRPSELVEPPAAPGGLLVESFDAEDGAFVSKDSFWSTADRGLSQNADWFAEDGALSRVGSTGRTTSPAFRMWTRRTDLAFATAEMDLRFNGWAGGSDGWHGVNLWMNRTLCTPVPSCSAVGDAGGNSGYVLDFMNRDGNLTILKKVPGDTRAQWPNGQIGYTQGGTYYWMKHTKWQPTPGQTYRFGGRVVDNGDGTSTLQVLIDGEVRLSVVDNGSMGGPRLTGGRVGLRSDYADITVDNLTIRK